MIINSIYCIYYICSIFKKYKGIIIYKIENMKNLFLSGLRYPDDQTPAPVLEDERDAGDVRLRDTETKSFSCLLNQLNLQPVLIS